MSSDWKIIGETGLQFFGRMSASISHEIKNTLAIINEDAGLLEDIVLIGSREGKIDPERVVKIAGKIRTQVQRADNIVKNMNSFSHSADEPAGNFDLDEIVKLIIALSGRFASMRGVEIEFKPTTKPVFFKGNSFLLGHIVWLFLEVAMDNVGSKKSIRISLEGEAENSLIQYRGLGSTAETITRHLTGYKMDTLLKELKAGFKLNENAGELIIILPRNEGV
jgi:signal transduction histidine kinase